MWNVERSLTVQRNAKIHAVNKDYLSFCEIIQLYRLCKSTAMYIMCKITHKKCNSVPVYTVQ